MTVLKIILFASLYIGLGVAAQIGLIYLDIRFPDKGLDPPPLLLTLMLGPAIFDVWLILWLHFLSLDFERRIRAKMQQDMDKR